MTKSAAGQRRRRSPDVMDMLARARPARLDPGARAQPPAEAAARIAASGQPPASPVPVPRPARRVPRTAVLTGTGLTAVAAAVAVAVLAASTGSPAAAPGGAAAGHGRTHAPVLLTAAMVRQVASASRAAMALSGQATIDYRDTQAGKLQDAGTDRITYSGKNWNDAFSQTFPASGGQSGRPQTAINRIVNGQLYLYIAGRTPKLQWYHDTNPSGHPSVTIPDPRTVLRTLKPSARFEAAGYQSIGGVRLKELRATDLSHLPSLSALPDVGPGERVTSLTVWVDGHGVVRRMALTSARTIAVYPFWANHVSRTANGTMIVTVPTKAMAADLRAKLKREHGHPRMIIHVASVGPGALRHEVDATSLTVSFSQIGQPQRITVPRHAIQQFGRG
jgi:hypothetical protein